MNRKNNKRRPSYHTEKYHLRNWQPPDFYEYGGQWGKTGLLRKTFYRSMAVIAILVLLLVIRHSSNLLGLNFRENLRYILTTEWRFEPMVQKAVQLGLQMVNGEQEFSGILMPDVQEAISQNTLTEIFLTPVSGQVVKKYGWSVDPLDGLERFHSGIDICAAPGTSVKAALEGKVARTGKDPALGSYILLSHADNTYTLYGCLQAPLLVAEGENVTRGQELGKIGTTGDVPGGGLHFELRKKNKLVDPLSELKVP